METWQILLRFFYQYISTALLYIEEGKIKGIILRQELVEKLSDLESGNINISLNNLVHKIKDLNELLSYYNKHHVKQDGDKVMPVINKNLKFVGFWKYAELIKSWENLPDIQPWDPKKLKKNDGISKTEKEEQREEIAFPNNLASLTILAMETLPMGILAIDTKGNKLFCNEDWLILKKKNPMQLKTDVILKKAKKLMVQYAFKKSIDFKIEFHLDDILPNVGLSMKFIRNQNKTVGYLFWADHSLEIKFNKDRNRMYKKKSLDAILMEEEKKILNWAFREKSGDTMKAAKMLGISKKKFVQRYNKYYAIKDKKESGKTGR